MRVLRSIPFLVLFLATLAGCSAYPRDTEGTLETVETQKIIRVGLISNYSDAGDRDLTEAFLGRLAHVTGASPKIVKGAAEPLLIELETNQLDLVIGEIAGDSPWNTDVAVIEPLAVRTIGERQIGLSPVARNGENRWIMLLERLVRNLKSNR